MICKNCGTSLESPCDRCPHCGAILKETEQSTQQEDGMRTPKQEMPDDLAEESVQILPKKFSGKAITGFVLALIGIVGFALPCGILSLVFSALAMKETELPQYKGRGMTISGLVISIIDIVVGIVYLVI